MSEQEATPASGADERPEEANASEPSLESLQARLDEALRKADEEHEALLRARAEIENMRRRHEQELDKARKYALERFAQELLPVVDSLEMGVEAAQAENATLDKVREGTELTLKMLLGVLEKFGIEVVHPHGEPFNPELHQAMTTQESDEHAPNTVMNVMQKGYTLNERLIRPAMVVVSKPSSGGKENETPKKGGKINEQA